MAVRVMMAILLWASGCAVGSGSADAQDLDRSACTVLTAGNGLDRAACTVLTAGNGLDRAACTILTAGNGLDRAACTIRTAGNGLDRAACTIRTAGNSLDRAACTVLTAANEARLDALASSLAQGTRAQAVPSVSRKSARKAFFLSLLLPGLGQRYLGQHRRAWIYLGAEAGVWAAVTTFYVQGSMREDRYREYAEIVGGADPGVDDDEYYKNLALYESSDVFATVVRWDGRALHPDDPEAQRLYYSENVYPADMAWSWPTEATFDEYKRLRRRSKRAYRTAVNVIGLSVLNRLVSAIDTVMGREKRQYAGGLQPVFSMKTLPGSDSPMPFLFFARAF